MRDTPYIRLEPTETGSLAFVALQLKSIGADTRTKPSSLEDLQRILNRQVDFIATLPGVCSGSAVELKLISHPNTESPLRGRIAVLLRISAIAENKDAAQRAVILSYESIWPNLMAISESYHWYPVVTKEAYDEFFDPSRAVHISELLRREANVTLQHVLPSVTRRSIGFHNDIKTPVEYEGNEGAVYFVFSYVRTYSRLISFFRMLQSLKHPVEISFALQPTTLNRQESEFLQDQIERCERFLQQDIRVNEKTGELLPVMRDQAFRLLGMQQNSAFSLLDNCFMSKVQVVSESPVSAGLMEALGGLITEPVNSRDTYSDTTSVYDYLSGGYDCVCPGTEAERQMALDNFNHLQFSIWRKGVAPTGVERLRYLLAAREANAVFRFPIPDREDFPGLETRLARTLPPPANLPSDGVHIGNNIYQGGLEPILMRREDRRRHMYVIGQTGTGKSTLLKSMVMQDICAGEGICVIDPHGNLVDEILSMIPQARIEDVIYFDPTDQQSVIGLNLLEYKDYLDRESAINHLLEIFSELYNMDVAGGPIFEQYLRNSAALAMADPERVATLLDIQRVFTDREFRNRQLKKCTDPLVLSFWNEIAVKITSDTHSLPSMSAYVVSKMSRFLYNELMRPIVMQSHSSIDFLDVMNSRKILLVDLAKGTLGSTNARFLGMILLSLIERAAFSRSSTKDLKSMPDFYLYVDEFQNVATEGFVDMLSEARKYRLNLILANQYFYQVPEPIRDAVIGNVGTKLGFRVGMRDAEMLESQFSTLASKYDLMKLSNYNAYITTLIDGEATLPFSLQTQLHDGVEDPDMVATVRAHTAKHYGVLRKETLRQVDAEWNVGSKLDQVGKDAMVE